MVQNTVMSQNPESVIGSLLKTFSRGSSNSNGNGNNSCLDPDEQQLHQQSMLSTTTDTPLMSALPSSADLLGLEQQHGRGLTGGVAPRRLHRQISECVPLPLTLPPPNPAKRAEFCRNLAMGVARVPALLGLLYLFVCSLDFLSTSFRLIAGKAAGKSFRGKNIKTKWHIKCFVL